MTTLIRRLEDGSNLREASSVEGVMTSEARLRLAAALSLPLVSGVSAKISSMDTATGDFFEEALATEGEMASDFGDDNSFGVWLDKDAIDTEMNEEEGSPDERVVVGLVWFGMFRMRMMNKFYNERK
mmetsp:Transcript_7306/g.15634  ORF Transcript_7306/g.15634 Transcript_7306/m.15634 type:complete len:127 (+) Transcript_7306:2500-2880(+)